MNTNANKQEVIKGVPTEELKKGIINLKTKAKTNGQRQIVNQIDHYAEQLGVWEANLIQANTELIKYREAVKNSFNMIVDQKNATRQNFKMSCLNLASNLLTSQDALKSKENGPGFEYDENQVISLSEKFMDYIYKDVEDLEVPKLGALGENVIGSTIIQE